MRGLDKEALKDPQGANYTLVAAPVAKAYSYVAASATGEACNNASVNCAPYTLTATLVNDLFAKSNLN